MALPPCSLQLKPGQFKIVSLLLEQKDVLDLDARRDIDKATPFFIAVEKGRIQVFRQLASAGADISLPKELPKQQPDEPVREQYPLMAAYINAQNQLKDSSTIFSELVRMTDGALVKLEAHEPDTEQSHNSPEYQKAKRFCCALEDLASYDSDAMTRSVEGRTVPSVFTKAVGVVRKLHGAQAGLVDSDKPEAVDETDVTSVLQDVPLSAEQEPEPEPEMKPDKENELPPLPPPSSPSNLSDQPARPWWCILCSFCCGRGGDGESETDPLLSNK